MTSTKFFYLVYTELDGGDEDRSGFAKLRDAKTHAMAELGDPNVARVYIERVEEGFTNDEKWDLEIGIDTLISESRN